MHGPGRLDGRAVLVTRPATQAASLCQAIEALGGDPVAFPTVEILPARDPDRARQLLRARWDIVIFISRNAVEQALDLLEPPGRESTALDAASPGASMPFTGAQLAAVGKATAVAMQQAGLTPGLVPASGFDSEALLALPGLTQVQGWRVLIVRGEGGRPVLGETLAARGAEVVFAEVYRRAAPRADLAELLPDWQARLDYLTATSDEVLSNLVDMLPASARPWLLGLPLAVLSERNAQCALQMGFRTVAVASEASDAGLCDALCRLNMTDIVKRAGRPAG
jgi:uroporphyrinogen-III synthase